MPTWNRLLRLSITEVRKDLSAEISEVRKDMINLFDKTDSKISDVRKDMEITRKDLQLGMSGIRAEQNLISWMLSSGILDILSLVVKAFLMTAL
ncbi:MAG: hypothetical protein ACL7BU_08220 [Candidatus Phlomobacter fragariae]